MEMAIERARTNARFRHVERRMKRAAFLLFTVESLIFTEFTGLQDCRKQSGSATRQKANAARPLGGLKLDTGSRSERSSVASAAGSPRKKRKECRAEIEMDVSALWNSAKKWNQERRISGASFLFSFYSSFPFPSV